MCIHQPCAFQVQLAVHILEAVTILDAHRVASYAQHSYVFMQASSNAHENNTANRLSILPPKLETQSCFTNKDCFGKMTLRFHVKME